MLVTCGEHVSALAAVRELRAAGFVPFVAATEPRSLAARSRATAGVAIVPDARRDERGFATAVAAAAEKVSAAAVLPGSELALVVLSEHRELLPAGCALGAASEEAVELATDKGRLARLAADAGLRAPAGRLVHAGQSVLASSGLRFPAVVKPVRSAVCAADGGRGHVPPTIVHSSAELASALRTLPNARGLVQPYLEGPLHSVAGLAWDGRLLRSVHAVAERIWPRGCGSLTSAVTVPPDPELDRAVARLLGKTGWNGIFQLDLIVHDGEPYLLDLNPRLYTSLAIARAAGADLVASWVRLLLGGDPGEPRPYRSEARYRYETRDLAALLAEARDGRPLTMLGGLLPRRGTVHAVFDVRDPLPLLAELRRIRPAERRRRRAVREGR